MVTFQRVRPLCSIAVRAGERERERKRERQKTTARARERQRESGSESERGRKIVQQGQTEGASES